MPTIEIREKDLTRGGGTASNFNVVYVPGCMSSDAKAWPDGKDYAADANTPILCRTIEEFESYFGTRAADFSGGAGNFNVDKSYLYAKDLIQLGLPVLYESVNDCDTAPTVETFYAAVENDSIYKKLSDKSEYQFKYLTSGGYPLYDIKPELLNSTSDASADEDTLGVANIAATITTDDFPKKDSAYEDHTILKYQFKYLGSNKWRQYQMGYAKEDDNKIVETGAYEDSNAIYDGACLQTSKKDYPVYYISRAVEKDGVIVNTVFIELEAQDEQYKPVKNYGYTFYEGDTLTVEFDTSGDVSSTKFEFVNSTSTGGSSLVSKLTNIVAARGDCIGLIDHSDAPDVNMNELYADLCTLADGVASPDSCAIFTPWVRIDSPSYVPTGKEGITLSMPPSYAYLAALAKSIKTNASWLAVAGASRGQIPNLNSTKPLNLNSVLTNSMADSFQTRNGTAINAITNIKPFGHRIWGNRTLKDNANEGNLTATSFLNIRNLICDVKKVVYEACRKYTFEQNNDILWLNFKAYIEPTLNNMKTGAGLSGYKIIKGTTTEKAKLVAKIKLYPIYAAEDFDIEVLMLDEEIKVS